MSEVRIISKNPDIDITVPMGDGVATLPGTGLGGWKSVERIEDVALSDWEGQAQLTQDVPLMLDGWGIHPQSVQRQLDTILKLGRDTTGDESVPPVFQVWGPVHFPGKWWVLPEEGIELSTNEDEVMRGGDGTLYRQALTLHLLEYTHDIFGSKKKRPPNKGFGDQKRGPGIGPPVPLTHTTSANETFSSIAKDVFNGEWKRWSEIADKNPVFPRSPFLKLPPNRTLVL